MFSAKQLEKARNWVTFFVVVGGAGFTVAVTLASKASASNVEAIEKRLTTVETHHDDDDRLIDWLVKATWMQHPELPAPPERRLPRDR